MPLQFSEGDVQLQINGDNVAFVSIKVKEGRGTITTNTSSTGGGGVQVDHAQSIEEKKAVVTITVRNTMDNINAYPTWQRSIAGNTIGITSFINSSFSRNFTEHSMVNDPEYDTSTDGTFDLVFEGNSAL